MRRFLFLISVSALMISTAQAQIVTGSATQANSATPSPCGIGQVLSSNGAALSCANLSGGTFLAGKLTAAGANAANMTVTTDQQINLTRPASGTWIVVRAVVTNCTANESAATGAIYGSTAKAGGVIVGLPSFAYQSVTGLAASKLLLTPQGTGSTFYAPIYSAATQTVQFSLTAAAASGTCDVYVYGEAL